MPFKAGGDACAICQALNGTNASAPAHANCSCQSTKEDDDCEYEWESVYPNNDRYGPGNYQIVMYVEISVYCNDEFVGGISTSIDVGGYSGDALHFFDYVDDLVESEGAEMCNCEPPLVA
jgi:hypothetical protein